MLSPASRASAGKLGTASLPLPPSSTTWQKAQASRASCSPASGSAAWTLDAARSAKTASRMGMEGSLFEFAPWRGLYLNLSRHDIDRMTVTLRNSIDISSLKGQREES